MGRIADALKRAEHERRFAAGASRDGDGGVALLDAPDTKAATGDQSDFSGAAPPAREAVSLVKGMSESLVPYYERSSTITEQYRSLRTRLLSQNPQYEHRVLAITSAVPREGKSVTTLNLGCILAEIHHLKVLVVDGDFRRGSLAGMLDQDDGPGLADVFAGEATYGEVIRSTPIPNMMFMPAGDTRRKSAAELLTASDAQAVFHRMRTEFHYTIVDTPPATTVSDVGIIGQMCSGVIIVVRLHRTAEVAAKRTVRLLQVNNIPIVGCLLVGRDTPGGRYGAAYGYGLDYYRYYDRYQDYGSEQDDREVDSTAGTGGNLLS